MRYGCCFLFFLCCSSLAAQQPNQRAALLPREALGTFKLDQNFTIELVAAEPDVVDPVCFCFDAKGDLYVVEMRGYPNGGKGEGLPNLPGRIRKLEDRDGDGYFETSTIFADGLRFPTAIMPWRNGFLVGDAPDLLFLADPECTGKATERKRLYTGFGNSNIQQMINGLQLHWDGWVHGCNGGNDSPVKSLEKPEAPIVQLRGMHFRFKPDVPGSMEATSGGGQYGLAVNERGHWFTCTNSQHLRHIVLPHHYLKRNPYLSVPAVTVDIPDHGAAAQVFRISPFEAWRVERTTRRAGSDEAKRFPTTELVPGGFITSACGLAIYDGGLFPKAYHGNAFVCDPANNLIHRDVLVPHGSTYIAQRHDQDCEFLASTDTWFRPVFLATGPDGCLYVADFYREIIETPLSLPEDIKARWNLNSRELGRIWRIKPKLPACQEKATKGMEKLNAKTLVPLLDSEIGWTQKTAFRLLGERKDNGKIINQVNLGLLTSKKGGFAYLLNIVDAKPQDDLSNHEDTLLSLRLATRPIEQAIPLLMYLEDWTKTDEDSNVTIRRLKYENQPQLRFQLALSLGQFQIPTYRRITIAHSLLLGPSCDVWLETAVLSSMSGLEKGLLFALITRDDANPQLLERIANIVSRRHPLKELQQDKTLAARLHTYAGVTELAIIRGLGPEYAQHQLPGLAEALKAKLRQLTLSKEERSLAISLLAFLPWKTTASQYETLLGSQASPTDQMLAIQSLRGSVEPAVAQLILQRWSGWSPQVRREAQEVLLGRQSFILLLLDSIERQQFRWRDLDPTRREQLLRSRNSTVQTRAKVLQATILTSTRASVLKNYAAAVEPAGDVAQGKALFAKHCASCHQLENVGHAVGPDLAGALVNKTRDALLIDLLDPNREVDPRYVNYVIVTKAGRTVTGIISSEAAASITLKRAEGMEETILRSEIDEMQATGKSLMPEGLEEQLSVQQVAEVMSYVLTRRR